MRVTRKNPSAPMAWLVKFLNLNFEDPGNREQRFLARNIPPWADGHEPARARSLQWKWNRLLTFIVEPKSPAESLRGSIRAGIAVHDGMLKTALPGEHAALKSKKAQLESFLRLGEKEIVKRFDLIRKSLAGAVWLSPEEALANLVQELNHWSIGKTISPIWTLETGGKRKNFTQTGQGVLEVARKKFAVHHRLVRGRVLETIHDVPPQTSLEDIIYSNVARCLETGKFDRLRRCQLPRCRQFFFAVHFNKCHCKPEHQKEHDQSNATARVARARARQRKALRAYALAILPQFAERGLTGGNIRNALGESFDWLETMVNDVESGTPAARVWARASSKKRALFRKLQAAGIKESF